MYFGLEHKMKVVEVAKYYIFSLKNLNFALHKKVVNLHILIGKIRNLFDIKMFLFPDVILP